MPTYTYKCLPNEHYFEARQKFSDDPLTECPECGEAVRRVINSVGIVFKGKGFYVTDNRGSNGKNGGSKSSSDSKAEGGKKSEAGGEAKADSKASSDAGGGDSAEKSPAPKKEASKAKE